jgi:predicted ferric reductase
MLDQLRPRQIETAIIRNIWYRIVLAVVTATAFGVVMLPILPSVLTGASPFSPETLSHITRASAFAAYVLIWLSMLAGLSITSKVGRKRPGMTMRFGLHRFMSLLGLGFASMHALSLLGPGYMSYTPGQLLVPFMAGEYKPQWLGLGQVALYSLAIIACSFYFRDRLGVRAWRLVHSLSFALFLMALIHGMQSGSDSGAWWSTALYWVSAASVLLGSLYRVLAARAGRPKEGVAATGLVLVGGRAQAHRGRGVLQSRSLAGRPTP